MSLQQLLFFDVRQGGLEPGCDRLRILLQRAFIRLLAGEAEPVQDSADVIAVMPDAEVKTDDFPDSGGGPSGVGEAMNVSTFVEEPLQGVALFKGECRHSPCGHCGLQCIGSLVPQELLPSAKGTHRDTQELGEFFTAVLAGFKKVEEVEATFFELSSREARRQPSVSHTSNLTSATSAGINNARPGTLRKHYRLQAV